MAEKPSAGRHGTTGPFPTVLLRYAAKGTVAMRGSHSLHPYLFSDRTATPVPAPDAAAFLRSGLLVRLEVEPPVEVERLVAPEPALEFLAAVTPVP
jgi:hypothetical protein